MKYIAVIVVLLFYNQACADEIDMALDRYGFEEKAIPSKQSHEYPLKYYVVSESSSGNIIIKELAEKQYNPEPIIYEAGDNKYIGTDHGEFGGKLIIKTADGEERDLVGDNVQAIIPFEIGQNALDEWPPKPPRDVLLVFTGLSHGITRGAVYSISSYNEDDPDVELFSLLPECPEVILHDKERDDRLIVITHSGVTLITTTILNRIQVPASSLYWGMLYLNSAVQEGDRIIVGMREGVSVIKLRYGKMVSMKHYIKE